MIHKLPELEQLKELLKDTNNILWYKRVEFTGSEESVDYLKRKIKEFNALMDTGENNTDYSGSLQKLFIYYYKISYMSKNTPRKNINQLLEWLSSNPKNTTVTKEGGKFKFKVNFRKRR